MEDGSSRDLESLRREHSALLRLVQALVIVLVVLASSLNVFLLREVTLVRNDLNQRLVVIDQYNSAGRERLENFLKAIREYVDKDPEFAPVLNAYFPETNQVANLTAPLLEAGDSSAEE